MIGIIVIRIGTLRNYSSKLQEALRQRCWGCCSLDVCVISRFVALVIGRCCYGSSRGASLASPSLDIVVVEPILRNISFDIKCCYGLRTLTVFSSTPSSSANSVFLIPSRVPPVLKASASRTARCSGVKRKLVSPCFAADEFLSGTVGCVGVAELTLEPRFSTMFISL
jgi:hypothetical protein